MRKKMTDEALKLSEQKAIEQMDGFVNGTDIAKFMDHLSQSFD